MVVVVVDGVVVEGWVGLTLVDAVVVEDGVVVVVVVEVVVVDGVVVVEEVVMGLVGMMMVVDGVRVVNLLSSKVSVEALVHSVVGCSLNPPEVD